MKSLLKYAAVAAIGFISFTTSAQEKKELKKEIIMEENNGEKILTIETSENGNVTKEVYKGDAADKKLSELEKGKVENEVREEVNIEVVNGEKIMTVTKTENGVTTTEVLKGEEAEAKEKEMEMENSKSHSDQKRKTNPSMKKIEVKKIEVKEKN